MPQIISILDFRYGEFSYSQIILLIVNAPGNCYPGDLAHTRPNILRLYVKLYSSLSSPLTVLLSQQAWDFEMIIIYHIWQNIHRKTVVAVMNAYC